ncbi:hypothetical protein V2J09_015307 [Rumex salicifolius]
MVEKGECQKVGSDLPIGSGEGAKITHLDHSVGEIGKEGGGSAAVSGDGGVGGLVAEELLVGVQQPLEVD